MTTTIAIVHLAPGAQAPITYRERCQRNSDGDQTCGYNCQLGSDGKYYCASTPAGTCGLNSDGTYTCS